MLRNSMAIKKRDKPKFKVPDLGFKNRKRIKERWRRQRGIDNKMRIKRPSHGATPSIGYKNSADARFRTEHGKLEVLVHNKGELLAIDDAKNYIAVFSHALSAKKRQELQSIADSKGIEIANRSVQ